MVGTKKILQDAATATGAGSTLAVNAYCYVVFQVVGTFSGTVTFQATVDGTNWIAVRATNMNTGTAGTTATAAGLYQLGVAGIGIVRANITVYASGTITVWARATEQG